MRVWHDAVEDADEESIALSGEAVPGRLLLGMQRADWDAAQLPSYAHGPFTQPEAGPWEMMCPPTLDNLFARSAASRRFFTESVEYNPKVS